MKTKKILWSVASIAIVLVTAFNLNQSLLKQNSMLLSAIAVANLEALADDKRDGETNEKTDGKTDENTDGETADGEKRGYETADMEEKRASGGWTYDASLKVWLLNGKVQKTEPSNVITIKSKCCYSQGPDANCAYKNCPF